MCVCVLLLYVFKSNQIFTSLDGSLMQNSYSLVGGGWLRAEGHKYTNKTAFSEINVIFFILYIFVHCVKKQQQKSHFNCFSVTWLAAWIYYSTAVYTVRISTVGGPIWWHFSSTLAFVEQTEMFMVDQVCVYIHLWQREEIRLWCVSPKFPIMYKIQLCLSTSL